MPKPVLTFESQLDTVPVLNGRLDISESKNGQLVRVGVELRYHGIARLLQGVFKLRRRRYYDLQGIGLEVFQSIDGKRTFEQLIDGFAERHKLTFLESRALLMQYIQMLMQRGIISIAVRKDQ